MNQSRLYKIEDIDGGDAYFPRRNELVGKYFYGRYESTGYAEGRIIGFENDRMVCFYKVALKPVITSPSFFRHKVEKKE
jgi:hypothetical protein